MSTKQSPVIYLWSTDTDWHHYEIQIEGRLIEGGAMHEEPAAAAQVLRLMRSNDLAQAVVILGEPPEPCPDCDGTGWASATNAGTGGGTGRDEQIAVECPRGCEPQDDDVDAAHVENLRGVHNAPPPVILSRTVTMRQPLVSLADVDPNRKPTAGERAAYISGAKRQWQRVVEACGEAWAEDWSDLDPRYCDIFSHGPIVPRAQ
jgi:hypothetical protein